MCSDNLAWVREHSVPEPNSGCWLWLGDVNSVGRAVIGVQRTEDTKRSRKVAAARVVWENATGEDPGDRFVLHKCDVKLCVNPAHLYLGHHKENFQDRVARRVVCKRGHNQLVAENVYVQRTRGVRLCRVCLLARNNLARRRA